MLMITNRNMQTKTTRYYLISVRMDMIKKSTNANTGQDMEKEESSYIVGGNIKQYSHFGKQFGRFSKS